MGGDPEGESDVLRGPPPMLPSYCKSTVSGDSYASSIKVGGVG